MKTIIIQVIKVKIIRLQLFFSISIIYEVNQTRLHIYRLKMFFKINIYICIKIKNFLYHTKVETLRTYKYL